MIFRVIRAFSLFISLSVALVLCLPNILIDETKSKYWLNEGLEKLNERLSLKKNTKIAKNIIIYLGDGMGVPTVTSGRIFIGQKKGLSGEEYETNFEKLDYVALSKVKFSI